MTKKLLFSLITCFSIIQGDSSCIGYTTYNLQTGVTEDGPLRYVGCTCNCAQYRWLPNTTCIECDHKHSGAITLGRIQFTNFTTTWLPGLMAFVKNKQQATNEQKLTLLADNSANYYEGTSVTGQAFDGPSLGSDDEDGVIYYSDNKDTSGDNTLFPGFGPMVGGSFGGTITE